MAEKGWSSRSNAKLALMRSRIGEEFELPWKPGMNVISSLMDIAANPVNRQGEPTSPIFYDSNCLEEVCGSCAMLINGRTRMACSALIDNLSQPVRLEPFAKFPVVRDLAVDVRCSSRA